MKKLLLLFALLMPVTAQAASVFVDFTPDDPLLGTCGNPVGTVQGDGMSVQFGCSWLDDKSPLAPGTHCLDLYDCHDLMSTWNFINEPSPGFIARTDGDWATACGTVTIVSSVPFKHIRFNYSTAFSALRHSGWHADDDCCHWFPPYDLIHCLDIGPLPVVITLRQSFNAADPRVDLIAGESGAERDSMCTGAPQCAWPVFEYSSNVPYSLIDFTFAPGNDPDVPFLLDDFYLSTNGGTNTMSMRGEKVTDDTPQPAIIAPLRTSWGRIKVIYR
jgi:hypothetical protein